MMRSSVVLPHPLGPIIQMNSPGPTCMSIPSSARTSPLEPAKLWESASHMHPTLGTRVCPTRDVVGESARALPSAPVPENPIRVLDETGFPEILRGDDRIQVASSHSPGLEIH